MRMYSVLILKVGDGFKDAMPKTRLNRRLKVGPKNMFRDKITITINPIEMSILFLWQILGRHEAMVWGYRSFCLLLYQIYRFQKKTIF